MLRILGVRCIRNGSEIDMILMADLSLHAFIAITEAAVLANGELVNKDRQPLEIQILVLV